MAILGIGGKKRYVSTNWRSNKKLAGMYPWNRGLVYHKDVKKGSGGTSYPIPPTYPPYTPPTPEPPTPEPPTPETPTPEPPTPAPPTPTGGGGGGGGGLFEVDLAGIWETAGMMADNEISPQLAEIDRLLQQAGYTADESERAINEAYPIARRSVQKAIYENYVAGEGSLAAMGTGRGGGRQELLARAGEREATGMEAIEGQKTREIGAIKRALESYRGQMGTTRAGLVGSRGALQGTYAEQLRGNRFNEAATVYNAKLGLANLAESARQFNANLAEGSRQFNESLANRSSGSGGSGTGSIFDLYGGGTNYQLSIDDINTLLGIKPLPAPKRTINKNTASYQRTANMPVY